MNLLSNAVINTNSTVIPAPMLFGGIGNTYTLQSNLSVSAAGGITVNAGNINLNGYAINTTLMQFTAGSPTGLTFNGGGIYLSGSPNAWLVNQGAAPVLRAGSANGSITVTAPLAANFQGGNLSYPATLVQATTAPLLISGNNTFTNLTNSVVPATLLFAANSTTTLGGFTATGTPTGTLTIGSINPGISANLSVASGSISVSYARIQDSHAQGGATWMAYGDANLGNNTGWQFAPSGLHPVSFGGLVIGGGIDLF
jgi:hypothetical protein